MVSHQSIVNDNNTAASCEYSVPLTSVCISCGAHSSHAQFTISKVGSFWSEPSTSHFSRLDIRTGQIASTNCSGVIVADWFSLSINRSHRWYSRYR